MTIPKFRAWDNKHKEMLDWEQIKSEFTFKDFDDDNLDFMQYTGMKDKNNVDIYENDIVVEEYRDSLNYGRVFYSEKKACHRVEFKNLVNGFDLADVAVKFVAGNVYENPELLEGEE